MMPTLFISHGAPTFALQPGLAGAQLRAIGQALHSGPRPEAVLVVSPHWMTRDIRVTTHPQPPTIHDFGGFDPALYQLTYPAAGHAGWAETALELLRQGGWQAQADARRGFDHGAWVPLMHLFPQADVPVIQVSMPASLNGESALALGRALHPLTHEGVLIIGSGSLTHNLYEVRFAHQHPDEVLPEPDEEAYVGEFSRWVDQTLRAGDHPLLARTMAVAPSAQRAHPTAEHYWPLLVAAGAAGADAPVQRIDGGVTHGVISMTSYLFGQDPRQAGA